jgi:hypothetical protein
MGEGKERGKRMTDALARPHTLCHKSRQEQTRADKSRQEQTRADKRRQEEGEQTRADKSRQEQTRGGWERYRRPCPPTPLLPTPSSPPTHPMVLESNG